MHHPKHPTARPPGLFHRLHHALVRLLGGRFPRRGAPAYRVPEPPDPAPVSGVLRFFDPLEAATIDALTARIFPAGGDGPGAHEADVVNYVDYLLSQEDSFAQPIYRRGPFARTFRGDSPPERTPDGEPVVWVAAEDILRYGFQSAFDPKETYRAGIAGLNRYSRALFGAGFVDLTAEQQDAIVEALADDRAEGFDPPGPRVFFQMVQEHTIEGMFADPQYGGNRHMGGWRTIGFPGAQRAYLPEDLSTEDIQLEPQSLAQLHAFHPRTGGPHPHPAVASPMPLSPRAGRRR